MSDLNKMTPADQLARSTMLCDVYFSVANLRRRWPAITAGLTDAEISEVCDRMSRRKESRRALACLSLRFRAFIATRRNGKWVRGLPERNERFAINGKVQKAIRSKVAAAITKTQLGMIAGCL